MSRLEGSLPPIVCPAGAATTANSPIYATKKMGLPDPDKIEEGIGPDLYEEITRNNNSYRMKADTEMLAEILKKRRDWLRSIFQRYGTRLGPGQNGTKRPRKSERALEEVITKMQGLRAQQDQGLDEASVRRKRRISYGRWFLNPQDYNKGMQLAVNLN